eukprot:1866058-Amphidinium_carterae.1
MSRAQQVIGQHNAGCVHYTGSTLPPQKTAERPRYLVRFESFSRMVNQLSKTTALALWELFLTSSIQCHCMSGQLVVYNGYSALQMFKGGYDIDSTKNENRITEEEEDNDDDHHDDGGDDDDHYLVTVSMGWKL